MGMGTGIHIESIIAITVPFQQIIIHLTGTEEHTGWEIKITSYLCSQPSFQGAWGFWILIQIGSEISLNQSLVTKSR